MTTEQKYAKLIAIVRPLEKVLVAFSGGVDSTFLLKVCIDVLGPRNVVALIASSETYPRSELEEALILARSLGAEHEIIETDEMGDAAFVENTKERCYFCKRHLFADARALAERRGITHIVEGSNSDDRSDYRPGRKAIAELGILSPLLDAGLTKAEIRARSSRLGLPTATKPSYACLASRIPYGTAVSPELLQRIERSEAAIRAMGLGQVRVRAHGNVARIEVGDADFDVVLARRDEIAEALRELGFIYVTLDLAGYRTGSMNEVL